MNYNDSRDERSMTPEQFNASGNGYNRPTLQEQIAQNLAQEKRAAEAARKAKLSCNGIIRA